MAWKKCLRVILRSPVMLILQSLGVKAISASLGLSHDLESSDLCLGFELFHIDLWL